MHALLLLTLAAAAFQKPEPDVAPTFSLSGSARDFITTVQFQEPGDGRVWARGRDYRASFGADGLSFLPVFGPRSPRELPVDFRVRRATVGGTGLRVGVEEVGRSGGSVVLSHGGFDEVYHLDLDGLEQTFVFDTLPGVGDVVIELGVTTELAPTLQGDGLAFVHPSLGHVTYGDAFALDATGARLPIARTWTGDGIELRVPAAFIAEAVLPLTIDPRVTAWVSASGFADDQRPDLCWDGRFNQYWVVWQEYTSAANADCWATSFNNAGVQGSFFAIETTNDDWRTPKVAFHYGSSRLLVVADEDVNGVGAVKGQLVDCATRTLVGGELTLSAGSQDRRDVDVGGDTRDTLTGSHFCVVWTKVFSATDRDIEYRVIDWDGAPVTNIVVLDSSVEDTFGTTISQSQGRHDSTQDEWTVAWIRDLDLDGYGSVEARRIAWNGATNLTSGNFVVDPSTDCRRPSVSSRLDNYATLFASYPRVSVLAYEVRTTNGPHRIVARAVADGVAYAANELSAVMEDVDPTLERSLGSVVAGRRTFYVTYSEAYFGNPTGTDRDVYYLAGNLSVTATDVLLALSERHQNVAFSANPDVDSIAAMESDGEAAPHDDQAAVVWARITSANGGSIAGYTIDSPTTQNSPSWAIGRQYCDANPNSGASPFSASQSSWIWLLGGNTNGSTKIAICVDVPLNSSGYLLTSQTSGDVNLAGGGQGRLCLLNPGRFVQSVQNSGTTGTFSTTVTPQFMPTPSGFVSALAGQTWHFQYWHRDSVSGTPTSNFSNACSMTFNI